VSEQAGQRLPALSIAGTLGAGRVLIAQAESVAAEDPAEALLLRREAIQVLELAAAREDAGQLVELARFQIADLQRRFPGLSVAAPVDGGDPAMLTSPPPEPVAEPQTQE
jgi:hypothetical protein